MILLLMNTFDLEEGSVTADNLSEMKGYLMATHPQEYAQLSPQLRNCSLEAELDTVSGRFVLAPGLHPLLPSRRAQAARSPAQARPQPQEPDCWLQLRDRAGRKGSR